jgi:hypothetical protein
MTERRTDELSSLVIEYALFLAETRGRTAALFYLESYKGKSEVLLRALHNVNERRKGERRREPRG